MTTRRHALAGAATAAGPQSRLAARRPRRTPADNDEALLEVLTAYQQEVVFLYEAGATERPARAPRRQRARRPPRPSRLPSPPRCARRWSRRAARPPPQKPIASREAAAGGRAQGGPARLSACDRRRRGGDRRRVLLPRSRRWWTSVWSAAPPPSWRLVGAGLVALRKPGRGTLCCRTHSRPAAPDRRPGERASVALDAMPNVGPPRARRRTNHRPRGIGPQAPARSRAIAGKRQSASFKESLTMEHTATTSTWTSTTSRSRRRPLAAAASHVHPSPRRPRRPTRPTWTSRSPRRGPRS